MGDSFDSLITGMVNRVRPVPARHDPQDHSKRKHQEENEPQSRESKDYLRTLQKAAESSNELLAKKNSLYRFRVYERDSEVFIDLIVLDKDGNVVQEQIRRITHESFEKWIQDLSAMEGLFLDTQG